MHLLLLLATLAGTDATTPDDDTIWRFDKFTATEYALNGVLAAAMLVGDFVIPEPPRRTRGGILFDGSVRRSIRASTRKGREQAGEVSDYFYLGMLAYPFLIDSLLVLGVAKQDWTAAWQLTNVGIQAVGIASTLSIWSLALVGRERPLGLGCDTDPDYDDSCFTSNRNKSFFSGHTTAAAAASGLICASQEALNIYGSELAGQVACGVAIAGAGATAILRVVSDRHWATDSLVGFGLGFASGYFLPKLLHFNEGESSLTVAPASDGRRRMLTVQGAF